MILNLSIVYSKVLIFFVKQYLFCLVGVQFHSNWSDEVYKIQQICLEADLLTISYPRKYTSLMPMVVDMRCLTFFFLRIYR